MRRAILVTAPAAALVLAGALAIGDGRNDGERHRNANCQGLPSNAALKALLNAAPGTGGDAGGLFHGTKMWGAIVNRDGEICAFTTGGSPEAAADPRRVWPISQAIAKAKAYTANGLNLDDFVLSTARLYTLVQPTHSLFGLNHSNPFDPQFLLPPSGQGPSKNQIAGGIISFGGGVGLFAGGRVVGGLGVSGDTALHGPRDREEGAHPGRTGSSGRSVGGRHPVLGSGWSVRVLASGVSQHVAQRGQDPGRRGRPPAGLLRRRWP